jgi:hypothetical protein
MTYTRDTELVQRAVLADCSEALLIAELERRGWGRGWVNTGDAAFDMLWREQDTSALPFDATLEWDEGETLSA